MTEKYDPIFNLRWMKRS